MDELTKLDNHHTDKNTSHSYLPLYNTLLNSIKDKARNVLEIGIGDFDERHGKAWRGGKEFF